MRGTALAFALCCAAGAGAPPQLLAQSPLERRITIHIRDVALRDALDRVAAAGEFRLSYSSDILALDRRVTLWRDTIPAGEALTELLRGLPVTPVAAANDQVVLAPKPPERDTTVRPMAVLDRVVVTGSVAGSPARNSPVALDVVSGRDIERRGEATLASVFDGSVPGVWMWDQPPSAMLARYASIRGASSFGVSVPKVYVDGIEVANPLLVTQLTPELIERIEVIRGPQGAALYGSDAISGVVNVVTRHDAAAADGARSMIRSEGGYATSFGSTAVAVQQHTVSTRLGSNLKSIGGSLGASTSGAYVPNAYSRELRTGADARIIGARSTIATSARFYGKQAGVPTSPLLTALKRTKSDSSPQTLRSYTVGSTYTFLPNEIWTLTATAGVDGYSLANTSSDLWGSIPAFADSALRSAGGSALRATMRASGVARVGDPEHVGATVSFSGEHTNFRDRTLQASTSAPSGAQVFEVSSSGNYGFTSQLDLEMRRTAYLRVGIRQEHISLAAGRSQFSVLPVLGGALVHDFGPATAKARVAFGRGIRAPGSAQRARGAESHSRLANDLLEPEEQFGVESGGDLFVGSALAFHVTRFDQVADGLIQEVFLGVDSSSSGPGSGPRPVYQLQNIGRIDNSGWEAQSSLTAGRWTATGALATVDSRVRRLAPGYKGDLRPGDRMLAVPARTLTGTLAWSGGALHLSSTVSQASDWINYDRLAIAEGIVAGTLKTEQLAAGPVLRSYWARYYGATHLRGAAAFDVRSGLTLTLTGENLLNHQTGEPDSITIVPGRTITAGIRARF